MVISGLGSNFRDVSDPLLPVHAARQNRIAWMSGDRKPLNALANPPQCEVGAYLTLNCQEQNGPRGDKACPLGRIVSVTDNLICLLC